MGRKRRSYERWLLGQAMIEACESASLLKEVKDFLADKERYPHAEILRERMSDLLARGYVDTLAEAYDAAMQCESPKWRKYEPS